ncbi:leucine-rich repeat domain-containing protein [Cerasicoccus frondis]|uniref:leucine-rich repeat domain-containing protein n=1 Tax=Cerasicoccus frondis TaxID=490090 RepID=UPI002852CA07|nr:leucine-rich repeat domain-containing protein [Cerasicoccus frondis]
MPHILISSPSEDMTATSFSDYALSPDLSLDAIYTVELLIERVRSNFDPNYWDDWSERGDARHSPGYEPHFSKEFVRPAAEELEKLSWLSFQRLRSDDRPVRDLTAIQFLTDLSELILTNNEVSDVSTLVACPKLKRLNLRANPIEELSPLGGCFSLEILDVSDTPIKDLSFLQKLPQLRELSISNDQIPALKDVSTLPSLRKLELGGETFESFEGFPEMPELRVIRSADVNSLSGLERYSKLENLVNLEGEFDSLEPLRGAKNLTHVNILNSRVGSLVPIAGLSLLCDLSISTEARGIDLSPLKQLPSLREIGVKCSGSEPRDLEEFQASLPSWDIDFRASTPRYSPSLQLEVVDQETFDFYDTKESFNAIASDVNVEMLGSELDWLDGKIEEEVEKLGLDLGDDYEIPFRWGGARSRTVVLYSERASKDFPQIITGIQRVLSNSKEDWIIYFQSDGVEEEFIVWVYPSKIQVTPEYEKPVRKLLEQG